MMRFLAAGLAGILALAATAAVRAAAVPALRADAHAEALPILVAESARAAVQQDDPAAAALIQKYRADLAAAWLREVVSILGSKNIAPENFEPALDLALRAADLTPDDPECWRIVMAAARICEPGLPRARDAERLAVARLVKLDPNDQVVQLMRLTQAVESYETAEERLAAYRKLLTPETQQKLGPVLSSRLAFEKALLESRVGDLDSFAKSLAEAVTLDPAFPAATELAAGFFSGRIDDPGEAAELLVAAIVANPTRIATYLDLGAILMAEGAYRSAARIYRLALLAATEEMQVQNDITSDLALALWGAGDKGAALSLVRDRIHSLDDQFRRVLRTYNNEMPESALNEHLAPLTTMMATLWATLSKSTNSPDAEKAYARLKINFKELGDRLIRQGETGLKSLAALSLENAWTTLVLGGDPATVPAMVRTAHDAVPLSEEAFNRFAGWERYRRGDLDGAFAALSPLAPKDPMARLGLGLVLVAQGDPSNGAREILAVANAERGTALGLVAADYVEELVKVRPGPGPSAAALDAAVAQLPQGFDRFIETASSALGLTMEPEKSVLEAFDPVRFKVTITNRSPLTLAIDPQGPIQARAACTVSLSSVGKEDGELIVSLIPIDRRLELAPYESMSFTYDASLFPLGVIMTDKPLPGGLVNGRCTVNFIAMEPRVKIDFMGREVTSAPVRINGARTDAAWVEQTWAALRAPEGIPDPRLYVLMAHYLKKRENVNDRARMLEVSREWQELAAIWPRFPALVQAWIIMVLPIGAEANGSLLDAMRESGDSMVLTSFLLKCVKNPNDVTFEVARRHVDERLGRLAEGVRRAIERRLEGYQREFGIREGSGAPSSSGSEPSPAPPSTPPSETPSTPPMGTPATPPTDSPSTPPSAPGPAPSPGQP